MKVLSTNVNVGPNVYAMEGGMAGAAGAAAMAQSRGGGGSTGDVEDGGVEMTTTAGEKDGGENTH